MSLCIREEKPADIAAIYRVNASAFPTPAEAELVDALRRNEGLTLSLVAVEGETLIGHIAFSPVTLTGADGAVRDGMGLAPMAVLPAHQRTGVGMKLVAEGLQRLRTAGHRFCVVLGHPAYYPRAGFVRASTFGIRWEQPVPDEVFMVQELVPCSLKGVSGVIRYRRELSEV